jgi:hypothetical protein
MIIFNAFGDWGLDNIIKKQSENSLIKYSIKNKPNFICLLGDNFYENGVESVNDPKWRLFTECFNSPKLNCLWYPVLGNHDYLSNPNVQVEFSKLNSRWKMGNKFYSHIKNNILILFIDTVGLALNESTSLISDYNMKVHKINKDYQTRQLKWIDTTLNKFKNNSEIKWKIICGHYPIYSNGDHGNTNELIEILNPLLIKHSVDLYISGHDHSFQHIIKDNINYVVSGCFSKITSLHNNENSLFGTCIPGFSSFIVTENILTIKYIDSNSNCIYEKSIIK